MRFSAVALLSLAADRGVSAAVLGTGLDSSQHVLSSSSSQDVLSDDVTGGFRCDLPPPLSPDGDGLPSADSLFSGPEAFYTQVRRHAALVRIPSVSYDDMQDVYEDPRWLIFLEVHRLLEELYPTVHARMNLTKINRLGLVYTLEGSDSSLRPIMLAAHQDVVPVADASTWTHPPFSAHFDGTFMWGRGSGDDKNSLTALLSTLEALLSQPSWTPRRSIVVAFGFDEETSGQRGAGTIATYLEERFGRDSMAFLLDEGSLGLEPAPGGSVVFALPSVLEKGHVDVLYELHVNGGHSSMPYPHTGIGIMAEIVAALEANPYTPAVVAGSPLHKSYICKARYAPEADPEITRLVRAGDLEQLAQTLAAMDLPTNFRLQTSQAVDMIAGGVKINAMPELVTLGVNYRVASHNTIEEVKAKTLQVIQPVVDKYALALDAFGSSVDAVKPEYSVDYNGKLVLKTQQATQPAPISPTTGPVWDVFSGTIQSTFAFEGGQIVPAGDLMNGNTDTRHYQNLTTNIYRFLPLYATSSLNAHTVDERVNMEDHVNMVKFYYNLIRNFDASDA